MCGVAGIFSKRGEASRSQLLEMAGELRHRGPDGTGLLLDGSFGMVNTRLSIVDLAGGDQPIGNEDGRYWVMQNGEIYNHPELRRELESHGHRFGTTSDTEVIVHAFEQWGPGCLDRMNGAFAFAVWDRTLQELFLARDRLGIRPLFLAETPDALVFASEAKALFRHPSVSRQLDPVGLIETFTLWGTSPDRSAFAGIRELAPGTFLRVDREGRREERSWWQIPFSRDEPLRSESEEALADEVYEVLRDATALRLRADVPVGAYLSGGLDSSTTAAIVRELSSRELRCFSVRFRDQRFDEGPHQHRMAKLLGVELESLEVDDSDIAAAFPEVIRLCEKPMARTAPAPLLLLSRLVRDSGFKVVLTGEGADEVFAGYNIFREDKIRRFWARQPTSTARPLLLRRLYPYLSRDLGRTGAFLGAFFGRHLTETEDPLYSHRIRFGNGARMTRLLHSDVVAAARPGGTPEERLIQRLPPEVRRASPLSRAQDLEIRTFLQGYLLHSQGDRMLMGHSVEGRFPFLDHRLAELAARIPDRLRIRALREKHILRKAAARLLPDDVAARPKMPYRAPISRAFLGPNAPSWVTELMDPQTLRRAGLFDEKRVTRLITKCRDNLEQGSSEVDEMALVGAISTMLLHDALVERPSLAPPLPPTKVVQWNRRDSDVPR